MDVIEMTRKLGQAIQEDERYKAYMEACSINDTDVEIQNKIGEFNQLRSQLSVEMQKPDKDGEKMTALDTQIRELYDEIMAMPKMIAFNEAKEVMDKLLGSVNYIISMAANGEDPMTCPEEAPHSCSGKLRIMRRLSLRRYQKTNNSQGELIPRLPKSEDHFRLGRIISIGIWRNNVC